MQPTKAKSFDVTRKKTKDIVKKIEELTVRYSGFLKEYQIDIYSEWSSLGINPFIQAEAILDSSLLKVIVCGEFSSGKSFLTSSLIGELEWSSVRNEHGRERDVHFTLLPTGATQTNSCPIEIRTNLESDKEYRLEVWFAGKKDFELVKDKMPNNRIANEQLWAYATDKEKYSSHRRASDVTRNVKGVRLYVPKMPFPAIFYDLPGIGGVNEPYRALVSKAINVADCIIYVAFVQKELRDAEIRLISEIEQVVRSMPKQCPVFFILSSSDVYGEEEIKDVLRANNALLQENFKGQSFIGDGFLVVDPSSEARALKLGNDKVINDAQKKQIVASSNMEVMRSKLHNYLEAQSGPARLHEIINWMVEVLGEMQEHTLTIEQVEAKPLQEAEAELERIRKEITTLASNRLSLTERLNDVDKRTIENASTIDIDSLRLLLEAETDKFLQKHKNVEKPAVQLDFSRKIDDMWKKWLVDINFEAHLIESLKAHSAEITAFLSGHLGKPINEELTLILPVLNKEIPTKEFQSENGEKSAIRENLDVVAKTLGLLGVGSGGTIATLTVTGLYGAAAAAGVPVLAGGLMFLGFSFFSVRRNRKEIKKQMQAFVKDYPENRRINLKAQVGDSVKLYRRKIEAIIDRASNNLMNEQKVLVDRRKRDGDLGKKEKKISDLREFRKEAQELESKLATQKENL